MPKILLSYITVGDRTLSVVTNGVDSHFLALVLANLSLSASSKNSVAVTPSSIAAFLNLLPKSQGRY